uniref:Uncharacterized protein n=1 Tax=Arundo donax TaxID=35708 RepID=A0A0A9EAI8_ARUDO
MVPPVELISKLHDVLTLLLMNPSDTTTKKQPCVYSVRLCFHLGYTSVLSYSRLCYFILEEPQFF